MAGAAAAPVGVCASPGRCCVQAQVAAQVWVSFWGAEVGWHGARMTGAPGAWDACMAHGVHGLHRPPASMHGHVGWVHAAAMLLPCYCHAASHATASIEVSVMPPQHHLPEA